MASEPVLPKEIFELMIDDLGQDLASYTQVNGDYWKLRQTLVNLALSCQSLRDRCTHHLYHTLLIWGQPIGTFNQFTRRLRSLTTALAIPRGPASYVRKVVITIFPCAGISTINGEQDAEHDYMQNVNGRWITQFLKALPLVLRNLSGICYFRLESRIDDPNLSFALIQRPARRAILRCVKENSLETLEVDNISTPWELLCSLPQSLQQLKLGGPSGSYLADAEMFEEQQEPPLSVRPNMMHLNLHPDFAEVISRQTRFFSHLKSMTYTFHDFDELQHFHSKILPIASANLQELDTDELRDALQPSFSSANSFPALKILRFIINHTDYAGRIDCPPRIIEIIDGYISQNVLKQIKALQITTTWNLSQACYPPPREGSIFEPFHGSWDALDASLAELPSLERFQLTFIGKDASIRQDASATELLRSQREAEMAILFPNTRSQGVEVEMVCGIIHRDSHMFSPNVR
ncbi:hypothetical protein BKA70DRAFT_1283117 [Coprinopsis sp. MPI-PUGE-AT-0042]|nr:hypothetical protein BKA70DRAFT_1283117 [Coprinopsis sp. MPI-PUGE-AT-0042]